jgi:hypothetical protein
MILQSQINTSYFFVLIYSKKEKAPDQFRIFAVQKASVCKDAMFHFTKDLNV